MSDVLKPDMALLCKLGSIAVHIDEALGATGHPLDIEALKALLVDHDVREWMDGMDRLALLPKRRDG